MLKYFSTEIISIDTMDDSVAAGTPGLSHSVSMSEHSSSRYDQNQNDDSVNIKESPTTVITQRMTKSASWFNSLSRRATRKTPTKKRTHALGSSNLENLAPGATRPRLNKSDWDVRSTDSQCLGSNLGADVSGAQTTSRSTDCLDLDGVRSDLSTLDLVNIDTSRTELDEDSLVSGRMETNTYYTLDARRLASSHKKNQFDRNLLYGVKQFNLQPERGLKYLQENGFIENNPESVAKFLFRQERLSKKQIGKYLGTNHDFNKEVLKKFVQCHEFNQLLLVQALRQFLWSFRLPGEAQQIDRVMDAFAEHYCQQNPTIFEEPDTCFILSFSIIMLNTALHNPNAKKMNFTIEQFIKQNRGINSGKDLAPDMLEAIFRSIKEEPFKIPDENYYDLMYTFFSPEREGWLFKQGGTWKTWKRRWFVIKDRCLYYFHHSSENDPKGIIPLENIQVRPVEDQGGKQFIFEIYPANPEFADFIKGCKTDSNGAVVQGNHKYYRLSATDEEDRNEWIKCIQDSISDDDNSILRTISEKKANLRRSFQPMVINETTG